MHCKINFKCIKTIYFRFYEDEIPALGAEFAYYLLLSFFPFLIFFITVIGYTPISAGEILKELSNILPHETYQLIKNNVLHIVNNRNSRLLSFSLVTTLWAASNGMMAMIRGLNKAYNIKEVRSFWKVRGIAILFTSAITIIIIFSFILLVFGRQIGLYVAFWLGLSAYFKVCWDIFRYSFMLLIMIFVFAIIYKYGPNYQLKWKEVLVGAVFASLGWIIASLGFSYYINRFVNYSKIYGSIGGIVVLLIWLHLSAIIILLGGELNEVFVFGRKNDKDFID